MPKHCQTYLANINLISCSVSTVLITIHIILQEGSYKPESCIVNHLLQVKFIHGDIHKITKGKWTECRIVMMQSSG